MTTRYVDGKLYRLRRGSWVCVPDEWVGQVPHKQTKRKRGRDLYIFRGIATRKVGGFKMRPYKRGRAWKEAV